ncbi:MAG: trehalose utilization [Novosphingobium pentaromativorans]|uniref:Trehalose utilization n=1 Tax=Novosphingobium pentaromativorans TaxID=205844 RepID=A0A2W5NUG5_9SPHN|nr:ThuA domain-containing protein [Novosphingobium panipatense]PZQ56584.1 MAG: trehalose utilization [Novosphingobium pentaromativorans]
MSETAESRPPRIDCVLICGGVWHDMDFARLELLKLLAEDPSVRTRVFEDYENLDAIRSASVLITYTCDVTPSLAGQEVLRDWLSAGGRWYALHGTNSVLRLLENGLWDAPRWAPLFMDLLGSQFVSHPPIAPYTVTVADPDHPLVAGIEPFETTDELYHMECHGALHVLLETECTEEGTGFVEAAEAPGTHPVMYIKRHGKGAVLYNTLGHCRGHYDLQPMLDWWPTVDRCAWDLPVFYDLLRRGIDWIKQQEG